MNKVRRHEASLEFRERFKGKTSMIQKNGFLDIIADTKQPILKERMKRGHVHKNGANLENTRNTVDPESPSFSRSYTEDRSQWKTLSSPLAQKPQHNGLPLEHRSSPPSHKPRPYDYGSRSPRGSPKAHDSFHQSIEASILCPVPD